MARDGSRLFECDLIDEATYLRFTPATAEADAHAGALSDREPQARQLALAALANFTPNVLSGHAPAVAALLADSEPEVRQAAVECLAQAPATARRLFAEEVAALLADEDERVRAAADVFGSLPTAAEGVAARGEDQLVALHKLPPHHLEVAPLVALPWETGTALHSWCAPPCPEVAGAPALQVYWLSP
jgi:hypothetical protein